MFISVNCDGYSDVTCYVPGSPGRHWDWKNIVIDSTRVELPQNLITLAKVADKTLSEYFEIGEVHNGNFKTDPEDVSISIDESGSYTVEKMLGTTGTVVRMFMLRVKQ